MSAENWKAIAGYEGLYEVSDAGRVRSLDRSVGGRFGGTKRIEGKLVVPFMTKWGYAMVSLYSLNGKTKVTVHSLVAAAFIGPRPDRADVNHKNGLKTDNRAENLEYVSRSRNHLHAYRAGLKPRAILDMDKAREIRRRYAAGGVTHLQLAIEYGVHRPSIGQVINNQIWREDDGTF